MVIVRSLVCVVRREFHDMSGHYQHADAAMRKIAGVKPIP
jgi:hypothetical protein